MITHRTLVFCIWMDGSKESERDKLKLTFEACNDGEGLAVLRMWQLFVLVFEIKYNEVNFDEQDRVINFGRD